MENNLLTVEEAFKNAELMSRIIDNIENVMLGKRNVVELTVMAMICGGHVLIEDVPGVGKTTLVSALAKSIACDFNRIQFTPDIMPSDITGFSVFNQKEREFEFRPGAVMSNLILADEINRASAKTQSSLLEAMEERQVTVDSNTYKLEEPFMVLATQNPLESYGTYPLPEAQIDRFLIKLSIGYPQMTQEMDMLSLGDEGKKRIGAVVTGEDVIRIKEDAKRVHVSRSVNQYVVEIVSATRNHSALKLGSSPRGSLALYNMAKTYAMYKGRNYVLPDDIKQIAKYVLAHRITLTHDAKSNGRTPENIIADIIGSIAIPFEQDAFQGIR